MSHELRQLPVHNHMAKVDILTGHDEIGICILFLRILFIAYLSKDNAFSQNLYSELWNYSILSDEILKYLFLKPWIKWDNL